MYLLVPPTPAQQPRPIIQPRPPIRHPRHIIHLTRSSKRTLLVILTSPGSTAAPSFSQFFGWWVDASIDKSTLWDQYQVSCIRVASRGATGVSILLPPPTLCLRIAASFLSDSDFFAVFKAISPGHIRCPEPRDLHNTRCTQNKVGHSQISLCSPGTDFASP
jgi:hypothetical protein